MNKYERNIKNNRKLEYIIINGVVVCLFGRIYVHVSVNKIRRKKKREGKISCNLKYMIINGGVVCLFGRMFVHGLFIHMSMNKSE